LVLFKQKTNWLLQTFRACALLSVFSLLLCVSSGTLRNELQTPVTADEQAKIDKKIKSISGLFEPARVEIADAKKNIRGKNADTVYFVQLAITNADQLQPQSVILRSDFSIHSIFPNKPFSREDTTTITDTLSITEIRKRLDIIKAAVNMRLEDPFEIRKCRDGYYASLSIKNENPNVYLLDGIYTCLLNHNYCVVGW
jgi:hypothetical protein